MDPISILMVGVMYACTHHELGNSCDEDAKCWSFLHMAQCREEHFGTIKTPAYLTAIKLGHNVTPRVKHPAVYRRTKA